MSWRLLLPAILVTARHATARANPLDQPLEQPQSPSYPPPSNDPATNPCASSYYYHTLPPPSTSYSWTNSDTSLTRLLRTTILTLVHGFCALHQRLNTIHTHNLPALQHLILHRPPTTALLTLSNHTSTLDDPYIITTLLPLTTLLSPHIRHSWCAEDVCFKRGVYVPCFRLGRIFPIRRGGGLYQAGVSEALSYMVEGGWMHVSTGNRIHASHHRRTQHSSENRHTGCTPIPVLVSSLCNSCCAVLSQVFPEGKCWPGVGLQRLKWGAAKLLVDTLSLGINVIVVPVIHGGMEDVLPLYTYVPRVGRDVWVEVGEVVDVCGCVEEWRARERLVLSAGGGAWGDPWPEREEELYVAVNSLLEAAMRRTEQQLKKRMEAAKAAKYTASF